MKLLQLNKILRLSAVFFLTVAFIMSSGDAIAKSKAKTLDPNDPASQIYLGTDGKTAGTGDSKKPVSEAYKAGGSWHPKALQGAILPKDKFGLVNWVEAVNKGVIKPKFSIDPEADPADEMMIDFDVRIYSKSKYVKDVIYPHAPHTYWLKCDTCHPQIFEMSAGANPMSMKEIVEGKWCGKCHGKVAFPLTDCNRCHTAVKEKAE